MYIYIYIYRYNSCVFVYMHTPTDFVLETGCGSCQWGALAPAVPIVPYFRHGLDGYLAQTGT